MQSNLTKTLPNYIALKWKEESQVKWPHPKETWICSSSWLGGQKKKRLGGPIFESQILLHPELTPSGVDRFTPWEPNWQVPHPQPLGTVRCGHATFILFILLPIFRAKLSYIHEWEGRQKIKQAHHTSVPSDCAPTTMPPWPQFTIIPHLYIFTSILIVSPNSLGLMLSVCSWCDKKVLSYLSS